MPTFFALILGWDAASDDPSLQLIRTAKTVAELRTITDFDPVGPFTTVLRAQFARTKVEKHDLINDFTGHSEPAAIYAMEHV